MSSDVDQLYRIRHSAAHIMAEAMLERFPLAKIAIGPPIEDGFYYDFDLPRSVTDEDLKWVERRMKKIIGGTHPFACREVSAEEARELFHDQPYKLELIDDLVNGRVDENGEHIAAPAETLTIYTQNRFTDLCRGPHVARSSEIDPKALRIAFRPPRRRLLARRRASATADAHLRHRLAQRRRAARLSAAP